MKIKEIKQSIESNIELFKENVLKLNSYDDLCRHYNYSSNGKSHKYFKELILKYDLSTDHWDRYKTKRIYSDVEKTCPQCGIKFISKSGGRTKKTCCGYSCSNLFFKEKRNSDDKRIKIKTSILKYWASKGVSPRSKIEFHNGKRKSIPLIKINCVVCGKEKFTKKPTQKCCSIKCSRKLLSNDPEYTRKLKEGIQKSIKEGRHVPWKSRNIISYPEKFFIQVLNNNNIKYQHNKPFKKYFIDFALDKNIALEIDGKQHTYKDRRLKDLEKDKALTENGWKVYRIPWNSINNEDGKLLMKNKIDEFLKFYNECC